MLETEVVKAYGIEPFSITPFGNGLINNTWLVLSGNDKFILQKINQSIFKKPSDLAHNLRKVSDHFKALHPLRLFPFPIKTLNGQDLLEAGGGWFRIFWFMEGSHTIDVVETADTAYEAAFQFGRFTSELTALDPEELKTTIPDFHNLSLRYDQFMAAIKSGNKSRISAADELIKKLLQHNDIVKGYRSMLADPEFKIRIMHHDTKISNVLFDDAGKGMCVIDLDTVMPGYFFSDVGDMMRTYLSPVSEEEKDFNKIIIRPSIYNAIVEGYLAAMGEELTAKEKRSFHLAGKIMIYMQALRFITDHLNDDVYYRARYEGHNFVRAGNQVELLEKFIAFNSIGALPAT